MTGLPEDLLVSSPLLANLTTLDTLRLDPMEARKNCYCAERIPIRAAGQPKRSRPFRLPGDQSPLGYADATSQTRTF